MTLIGLLISLSYYRTGVSALAAAYYHRKVGYFDIITPVCTRCLCHYDRRDIALIHYWNLVSLPGDIE